MSRPFAVGKIIEVRPGGKYLVHWFGNETGHMEGTYRPEWTVTLAGGETKTTYSAQRELEHRDARAYTSDDADQIVTTERIVCWGFELQYNDQLPVKVLRRINDEPRIGWSIPKV
jgi:hypothetical protein